MKQEVSFVTPKNAELDSNPRENKISDEKIKSLLPQAQEILAISQLIKETKSKKESRDLRKEFKDKYQISYTAELARRIKAESGLNVEKNPGEILKNESAAINVRVAKDQEEEAAHAVDMGVADIEEFQEKSKLIDKNRLQVVDKTIKDASNVIGWSEAQLVSEAVQVEKIKKARPGSKAQIELLNNKLDDILSFEARIKEAKGKEAQELRKEFKDTFGATYNVELMKKLRAKEVVAENIVNDENLSEEPSQEVSAELNETETESVINQTSEEFTEVVHLPDSEKLSQIKKARPASRVQIELLGDYLDEISLFETRIQAAEGKEAQKLRQEFKDTFGATYNVELMKKLRAKEVVAENIVNNEKLDEKSSAETTTNTENEDGPESQEVEKYDKEVLAMFNKLGISQEDLDGFAGFANLNVFAQAIIAKGLTATALEKAQKESQEVAAKKMQGKSKLGRFFQGVANSWGTNQRNAETLVKQRRGGLEAHGATLVQLISWASYYNFVEKENEQGEKQIDFLDGQIIDESNVALKNITNKLNTAALKMSALAKHEVITDFKNVANKKFSLSGKKDEKEMAIYQLHDEYEQSKADLAYVLIRDNKYTAQEAAQIITKVDAKVNMLQFLGANPDLQKDWQDMAKGKGLLRKMIARDNWKFLAAGFGGRRLAPLFFASAFGAATGVAAIPLVTASIGAWRAYTRTKKELKKRDRFIDKNSGLQDTALFQQRREALISLQSFGSLEQIDKNDAEKINAYQKAVATFKKLDADFKKIEDKNINKKALKSDSLITKLDQAVDKSYNNTPEQQILMMAALQRRINYTKELANKGLVNFGEIDNRALNMIDFYDKLRWAELRIVNLGFDYESADLSYDLSDSSNGKGEKIKIDMKARAEALIKQIEKDSNTKLSKKRKDYIVNKMMFGAVFGAAIGAAGVMLAGSDEAIHAATKTSEGLATVGATSQEALSQTSEETASQGAEGSIEAMVENATNESMSQATEETIARGTEEVVKETGEIILKDVISNEGLNGAHDSVWRSVVQIFQDNAESLGYDGSDEALKQWAEIQTSKALANSGEVLNKVFEGNIVSLEKVGDGFAVVVEQGNGLAPGMLAETVVEASTDVASTVSEEAATTTTEEVVLEGTKIIANEAITETQSVASQEVIDQGANKLLTLGAEMVEGAKNVLHTVIGDTDIYINYLTNAYSYINADGDLVSGSLINENGKEITDIYEFFAEKLDLLFLDDVAGHLPDANNFLVNNFAWARSLAESLGEEGSHILNMESGTLFIEDVVKKGVDEINLGNLDIDNIAEINPIETGYEIVLKNSEGIITLDDFETTLTGERIFNVAAAATE